MVQREVEELLRGGAHLATVTVEAEVCLRCGERLYSRETALRLEQVRQMLVKNKGEPFKPLGVSLSNTGLISSVPFPCDGADA